ncbi:hypothetical protein BKA80DRAFT_279058 [Phyllosticta citrichinensis]
MVQAPPLVRASVPCTSPHILVRTLLFLGSSGSAAIPAHHPGTSPRFKPPASCTTRGACVTRLSHARFSPDQTMPLACLLACSLDRADYRS